VGDIYLTRDDFANAFEAAFADLDAEVVRACAAHDNWPQGTAAAIQAALLLASAHPDLVRVLTIESFQHGLYGAMRYRHVARHFAAMLERGREQSDLAKRLPAITEEGLVGAIAEVVASRLRSGTAGGLTTLAPELIELTLIPYIGPAEAEKMAAA